MLLFFVRERERDSVCVYLTGRARRHGHLAKFISEAELLSRIRELARRVELAIKRDLQHHVCVQGLMAEDPEDPEQRLEVLGGLSDERPADPVAFHVPHPLRNPSLENRHEVVLVGEDGELEELLEVHVLVERRRGVVPVEDADDGSHGLRVVVGEIDGPFHAVVSRCFCARAVEGEPEGW